MAEQLGKAFLDYEEFLGSSYDKHTRHYKYYEVLLEALKDLSTLIYPPIRPNKAKENEDSSDEGNERSAPENV